MCERMSVWVKTAQASLKVSLANLTVRSESFQSESRCSVKPSKNFPRHLFTREDGISAGGAQKAVFITEDLCLECQKMKNILAPRKPPKMFKTYNQTKASFGFKCMCLDNRELFLGFERTKMVHLWRTVIETWQKTASSERVYLWNLGQVGQSWKHFGVTLICRRNIIRMGWDEQPQRAIILWLCY